MSTTLFSGLAKLFEMGRGPNKGKALKRLLTEPYFMSYLSLRLFTPDVLQIRPYTRMDRYPELFSFVKELMADKPNPRILSFGCSLGAEVATIRSYFPDAEIVGCDINKQCLKQAEKNISDEKITYVYSTPENILNEGPFDLIFCLAVFVHDYICGDDIEDCSDQFPFSKFSRIIQELDAALAPEGLLAIYVSNFRFMDTDVASNYRVEHFDTSFACRETSNQIVPQYDAANKRIPGTPCWDMVFRKMA